MGTEKTETATVKATMITWNTTRLGALALIAPLVLGASHLDTSLKLQPPSKVWISGTSTVQSFDCAAKTYDLQVNATGTAPVAAVLESQKAVSSVALRIPARQLDCRNGTMNEHMLKALKADQHANITFNVASYELIRGSAGPRARLSGTLSMGGRSKSVVVEADVRDGGNGVLRVQGNHEITMSEYGLKRPSLMLGTMKVGDRVTVHFDLYLKA
ncbi:MAG: YceI family protein [Dehalococcoidia bacterium]